MNRSVLIIVLLLAIAARGAYCQEHRDGSDCYKCIPEKAAVPLQLRMSLPITSIPSPPVEFLAYPETYAPADKDSRSDNEPAGRLAARSAIEWLSRWVNDPLTVITTALVILTFLYVRSVARQTVAIAASAEAAAKSANTAERALTELERPYVIAEITEPGIAIVGGLHGSPALTGNRLVLSLPNLGRTPAILTRLQYGITSAMRGSIAPRIDPAVVGGRELPAGTVTDRDRPYSEATNTLFHFPEEERESILADKSSVWIVGFVRYDDFFGNHHISGFAQVYDPIGMRFVARGDSRYNYARTETVEDIPEPSSRG